MSQTITTYTGNNNLLIGNSFTKSDFQKGAKLQIIKSKARFRRRISHVPNVIHIWVDSNY